MSAPVDVLAVMDETIRKLEATIPTPMNRPGEARERIEHFVERLHELRQARAVVAELVEAAKSLDSVLPRGEGFRYYAHRVELHKFRAALAKFGGAA